MNNSMRYFCYHFKKNIIVLVVMLIFGLLITGLGIHRQFNFWDHISNEDVIRHSFHLSVLPSCMAWMCAVLAPLEFAGFTNKRNIDTWFAFPLERWKLALIHMTNGLVYMLIVYSASAVCGFIVLNKYRIECHLDMSDYWKAVVPVFLIGICFYGVCLFAFVVANNIFDGLVFMGIYTYIPIFISQVFTYCLRHEKTFSSGLLEMLFDCVSKPQSDMTREYRRELYGEIERFTFENSHSVIGEWFWIVLGVSALAGVVFIFMRKKAEKTGGISDSLFGYRTLIPLLSALYLLFASSVTFSFWRGIITGLIVFIAYVIFRRGVRLKIPDMIVIGLSFILAMVPFDYIYELKYIVRFFI